MSTALLQQIDTLEKACHNALKQGDDAEAVDVLVRTLNTLKFAVSGDEPPLVRGLTNMATAHADMLLHSLSAGRDPTLIHTRLQKMCRTLSDLRGAAQHQAEIEDQPTR